MTTTPPSPRINASDEKATSVVKIKIKIGVCSLRAIPKPLPRHVSYAVHANTIKENMFQKLGVAREK